MMEEPKSQPKKEAMREPKSIMIGVGVVDEGHLQAWEAFQNRSSRILSRRRRSTRRCEPTTSDMRPPAQTTTAVFSITLTVPGK